MLNEIDEVEVLGLQKTIANEAYHLYSNNRDAFDFKNFPIDVLKNILPNIDLNKEINQKSFIRPKDFGYDYRVVFDWSDSNIEFNVQGAYLATFRTIDVVGLDTLVHTC